MNTKPDAVRAALVADEATKAMYVAAHGSDDGWLGVEGSYFISGVRAALDSQAAELEKLRTENANLKTVMVAAAEEIHAHWDAHCDAEGYGPQNLMRRLEEGIPSEYGYTAGRFAELQAELAALRASAASVQADQRAELDRLLAEHAATIKLATFGAWAAREFRDTLSDVDGGSAQEAMERFGVIEMHQVTEPCGEGCVCAEYDFPCDCYRFPPAISEAMDAALAAKGEGAPPAPGGAA